MNLLGELQKNVEEYGKSKVIDFHKDTSISERAYKSIKKEMLKDSFKTGRDTFVYSSGTVPELVDDKMREEGLICWRNNMIVKYVIPKKEV